MNEPPADDRSFEENLAELEEIVRELEDGKTSLETAIGRYERGIGLLKACSELLSQAEQKIMKLAGVSETGEPVMERFEHNSSAEAERRPAAKSAKPASDEIPF